MRATGFEPEDFDEDPVVLWPENEAAWKLFRQLDTQWRVGAAGATGLDYNVLFRLMDDAVLAGAERDAMFADIRVLESAALDAWSGQAGGEEAA